LTDRYSASIVAGMSRNDQHAGRKRSEAARKSAATRAKQQQGREAWERYLADASPPSKPEVPLPYPSPVSDEDLASALCDYCDEYHEGYVGCPYYEDFRRTTDVDDEEIERDAFARHDRRLFG
jgi:hypothetical protein